MEYYIRGYAPFYGDNEAINENLKSLYIVCFYFYDFIFILSFVVFFGYLYCVFKCKDIKIKVIYHICGIGAIYFLIDSVIDLFGIYNWLFD